MLAMDTFFYHAISLTVNDHGFDLGVFIHQGADFAFEFAAAPFRVRVQNLDLRPVFRASSGIGFVISHNAESVFQAVAYDLRPLQIK